MIILFWVIWKSGLGEVIGCGCELNILRCFYILKKDKLATPEEFIELEIVSSSFTVAVFHTGIAAVIPMGPSLCSGFCIVIHDKPSGA